MSKLRFQCAAQGRITLPFAHGNSASAFGAVSIAYVGAYTGLPVRR